MLVQENYKRNAEEIQDIRTHARVDVIWRGERRKEGILTR